MSIAETNGDATILENVSTLKSEERRESLTFFGLSMPAVLAILIVVFLPIFLAVVAFVLQCGGRVELGKLSTHFRERACIAGPLL